MGIVPDARAPDAARPEGILLLHGIARRSSSLRPMERAFRVAGFATLNLDYPARRAALAELVETIATPVAHFAVCVNRLHIVTHSMGGLLARALIARHRPRNLGRVVMLGPPNGGSEIADTLHHFAAYRRFFGPAGSELVTRRDDTLKALLGQVDYPLGIIAGDRSVYPIESALMLNGPNDGRVTVERTRCAGMSDHITLHTTHAMMMWNRRVIREALNFIRYERFGPGLAKAGERSPRE